MQDRDKYEYAIIRLVPKVARAEFFNIGVILYSRRKKFLEVKYLVDPKKLGCFSKEVDINATDKYLKAWTLVCKGAPYGGAIGKLDLPDRFRLLTASRSTMIQSSETHSGLCHDPKTELENLFEAYVL